MYERKKNKNKGSASTCKIVSSLNAPQGVEYAYMCTGRPGSVAGGNDKSAKHIKTYQ